MDKYSTKFILSEIAKLSFLNRFGNFIDVLQGESGDKRDTQKDRRLVKDLLSTPIDWNLDYVILKGGKKVKNLDEAMDIDSAWEIYYDRKNPDKDKEGLSEITIDGQYKEDPVRVKIDFEYMRGKNQVTLFTKDEKGEWEKLFKVNSIAQFKSKLKDIDSNVDPTGYDFSKLKEKMKSQRGKVKAFIDDLLEKENKNVPYSIWLENDLRGKTKRYEYYVGHKKKDPETVEALQDLVSDEATKDSILAFVEGVLEINTETFSYYGIKTNPRGFRITFETGGK